MKYIGIQIIEFEDDKPGRVVGIIKNIEGTLITDTDNKDFGAMEIHNAYGFIDGEYMQSMKEFMSKVPPLISRMWR